MKHGTVIRTDLVELWRWHVRKILHVLDCDQSDLSRKIGVSRQSVSYWLNNTDLYLSTIDFLASMLAIREMIRETDVHNELKLVALRYWKEIMDNYREKGLY